MSFLWPGLGHAFLRHRARALLFAVPPAMLLLLAAGVVVSDPTGFALSLLGPTFALAVMVLVAIHGAWRVLAILDTWLIARRDGRDRAGGTLALALLLSVTVAAAHLGAGMFVQSFAEAGGVIFVGDRPQGDSDIDYILGGEQDDGTGSTVPGDTNGDGVFDWNDEGWIDEDPGTPPDEEEYEEPDDDYDGPIPDFDPQATPPPYDPTGQPTGTLPADGPINVLFVGLDSGMGRRHSLSDTLIVASYFPARDTLTMISIPRDTGRMPLYKGGIYPRRINTFLNYARANPRLFPEGPIAALMNQVGYVLGTRIHYYAATNLDGLPRVIDLVGGVDVVLDRRIADSRSNLFLEPGVHHLDGRTVMPFVRSRYGPGNSDWQRARRQQAVIKAAAARVRDPAIAARIPQIVDGMTEVVRTNVPRDRVSTLLRILEKANDASTEHVVLSPKRYARRIPKSETGGKYMTELNIAAMRELSIRVFGRYSRYS